MPPFRSQCSHVHMPLETYSEGMGPKGQPLVRLGGEAKAPLLSTDARIEAEFLLKCLQTGKTPQRMIATCRWGRQLNGDSPAAGGSRREHPELRVPGTRHRH